MNYSYSELINLDDSELNRLVSNKYFGNDIPQGYDFVNNPSDAWLIILVNGISVKVNSHSVNAGFLWEASSYKGCSYEYSRNPLRAAMIVYLMMGDE